MGENVTLEAHMDGQPDPARPVWDSQFPTLKLFNKDMESYSTFEVYWFLSQVKVILNRLLPEEKDREAFWAHMLTFDSFFYELRNLPFADKAELDEWKRTHRITRLTGRAPRANDETPLPPSPLSPAPTLPDPSA
jgi:hypothetical protein